MSIRKHLPVVALAGVLAFQSAARGKPGQKELEQLLKDTDKIAEKVSKIRGLPVKKPIARGVMSKDQIQARVLERIADDYSDGELATEARAAKRLGLLPADADYKKVVIDLLTEQIAGFYDPVTKELYLADWMDVGEQTIVMAHEIDHALQDQNFDLLKFMKPIKDNADMQLARQALVEGDGTAIMIEYMFAEMGMKTDPWVNDDILNQMDKLQGLPGMEQFDKAPLFLRESLMFPYKGGLRLIAFTRRTHAWSRVDEMFKKPPASTEQVMHPEKYFAGEKPIAVKAGALPSLKKWKIVYQNVLGEMMWSVWLRQHGVKDERAADAAAGWGGDRYALFAPPGDDGVALAGTVMVEMSVWDEDADADQAFAAGSEAMQTFMGGGAPVEQKADELAVWSDATGARAWIEKKGKKVVIVIGAPEKQSAKLRTEVWKSFK